MMRCALAALHEDVHERLERRGVLRVIEKLLHLFGLVALGDNPSLPLKIKQGGARLGFIPLGDIPPL